MNPVGVQRTKKTWLTGGLQSIDANQQRRGSGWGTFDPGGGPDIDDAVDGGPPKDRRSPSDGSRDSQAVWHAAAQKSSVQMGSPRRIHCSTRGAALLIIIVPSMPRMEMVR